MIDVLVANVVVMGCKDIGHWNSKRNTIDHPVKTMAKLLFILSLLLFSVSSFIFFNVLMPWDVGETLPMLEGMAICTHTEYGAHFSFCMGFSPCIHILPDFTLQARYF